MKRRDDNRQLRPHEVEELDAQEAADPGTFAKASAEELGRRKMVFASHKRRQHTGSAGAAAAAAPASAGTPAPKPVFPNFADTQNSGAGAAATTPAAAAPSPFANFSFGQPASASAAPTAAAATPTFGSTAPPSAAPGATPTFGLLPARSGGATPASKPPAQPLFGAAAPAPSPGLFGMPAPAAGAGAAAGAGTRAMVSRPNGTPAGRGAAALAALNDSNAAGTLQEDMVRLNAKFARWVDAQLSENPGLPWNEGVSDYIAFADALASRYPDQAAAPQPPSPSTAAPLPSKPAAESALPANGGNGTAGVFGASRGDKAGAPRPSPAAAPASPFGAGGGGGSSAPAPALKGFTFGAPPPSGKPAATFQGFTTGAAAGKPDTAAAAKPAVFTGFTLGATGGGGGSGTGGFGGFHFGAPGAGGGAAAAAAAGQGDEGDGDEEAKQEPAELARNEQEAQEEEVVHEVRAKLYRQGTDDDGKKAMIDLGVGVVRLMKNRTTNARRLVMRNDIGKVQLNVPVYAGMKFMPEAKASNVKFAAPHESPTDMTTFALRVKKGMLQEFVGKLEALRPTK